MAPPLSIDTDTGAPKAGDPSPPIVVTYRTRTLEALGVALVDPLDLVLFDPLGEVIEVSVRLAVAEAVAAAVGENCAMDRIT